MSAVEKLLGRLEASGVRVALSPEGRIRVSPPGGLSPDMLTVLRSHKDEVLTVLRRDFIPRPLGYENSLRPWYDVWEKPLLLWLIDHQPTSYHALFEAEGVIRDLEAAGVTDGPAYHRACEELFRRFERVRRLKTRAGFKIWLQ